MVEKLYFILFFVNNSGKVKYFLNGREDDSRIATREEFTQIVVREIDWNIVAYLNECMEKLNAYFLINIPKKDIIFVPQSNGDVLETVIQISQRILKEGTDPETEGTVPLDRFVYTDVRDSIKLKFPKITR